MLKLQNVTKYYGKKVGIKNINLEINDKEIFGFIGPNGAGKSTTIKCILDFLKIENGTITIDNSPIIDKEQIGYLPSEINLYEDLKVIDMIKYNNEFYQKDGMKKAKKLIKELEIDTTKKIDELSLGNLKKVGIVLALMHNPKLIILDEPTSGLDPLMQEKFFEIMLNEKKNGNTIFFSSHNLNEVKRICDRVAIIRNGEIVEVNKIEDLEKNKFVNIKIKAQGIENLKVQNIKIKEKNHIEFIYNDEISIFLELIKDYKIDNLLITEPSLEEIFMHYYKEDSNV
ncbi:MAG: ABC transporter ATP-binding protein [Bacilli bacterium]